MGGGGHGVGAVTGQPRAVTMGRPQSGRTRYNVMTKMQDETGSMVAAVVAGELDVVPAVAVVAGGGMRTRRRTKIEERRPATCCAAAMAVLNRLPNAERANWPKAMATTPTMSGRVTTAAHLE